MASPHSIAEGLGHTVNDYSQPQIRFDGRRMSVSSFLTKVMYSNRFHGSPGPQSGHAVGVVSCHILRSHSMGKPSDYAVKMLSHHVGPSHPWHGGSDGIATERLYMLAIWFCG